MAMEQWCSDNPSNCYASDTYQSTSYTQVSGQPYFFLGDQVGTKPFHYYDNGAQSFPNSVSGNNNVFSAGYVISTDATVLNLLPNRDAGSVQRFLRRSDAAAPDGVFRWGENNINVSSVKRMALRWYMYHTPTFDWAYEGPTCTNGKIAHIGVATWGISPFITLTVLHGNVPVYDLGDGSLEWHSDTYSGWGGFDPAPGPGNTMAPSTWRGIWTRHEIVVRRPAVADSNAGNLGFDYSYFVKDVTNDTAEVEVHRLSSSCTGCLYGPANWVWDTGVYPSENITKIHIEGYRADDCRGWQGWMYSAFATWSTDAGQRIGAASEVEGGSGSTGYAIRGFRV